MSRLAPSVVRRLRTKRPFSQLPEVSRTRLFEYATLETLPRGAVLFLEGDSAQFVYYVVAGSIGLTGSAEKAVETVVEIFRVGELFVAPAAILRLPYLVSAVALAPARVVVIPAAVFLSVLEHDAALARAMVALLARHWRLLVEQLKDLKLRTAAERLAVYLLTLAGSTRAGHPATLDLRELRAALAARLNMTPENLSRAFATLRAHGVSSAGKTKVHIDDVRRLREFAYVAAPRAAHARRRRRIA